MKSEKYSDFLTALFLVFIFGFGSGLLEKSFPYYLRSYLLAHIIAGLAVKVWKKLPEKVRAVLLPVLLALGLLLFTAYLVYGMYNPFLYFRF